MAEERGGREEGGERILVVDGFDQSINDDIVSRWYRDATHDGRTQVNVTGVNFEVTPDCVCQGNFVPPVEVVKLRVLRVLGFEFLQLEIYSSVGYSEIRCFSRKKIFPEKPMMSSKYTSGNLYSLLFRFSRKDRIGFFFQELTKNHG